MAKLSILLTLINAHHIALSIFISVMSVVAIYYYLTIIKVMYFEEPSNAVAEAPIPLKNSMTLVTVSALFTLFLGIFPAPLLHLCQTVLV
jgi:NADH-quinone oxidoreductase subunit N